jgi:hypothetical protein
MKVWIVPSSLFVPGHLLRPMRLKNEREALVQRKAKLEAELAAMPGRIAEAEQAIAECDAQYKPYEVMERKP